ncbi:MAG: DUF1015 domain-containing protein [Actinomycetota bacterium]|nr:DUF1015 domain-containing protein [Actinomycetota bacterium]
MPDLRPFRGVRYARSEELSDIVCPPFDVISEDAQRRLHERHPRNAVRIELPFSETRDPDDRYRKAAVQFRAWLEEGVLAADEQPCLYVYRQDFTHDGAPKRVTGVIGALQLQELGEKSGVLPHERTMPGPVEDRLALLRACPVNISPIYAIYRGKGGLAPFLDSLTQRPPQARLQDESGTLHRMWVVRAAAEIEVLSAAVRPGPLVIADGHHRYETALEYAKESGAGPEASAVMCFCADADVEDLKVLPYHRAFKVSVSDDAVRTRLIEDFAGKELDKSVAERVFEHSAADHAFLVILPGTERSARRSRQKSTERSARRSRQKSTELLLEVDEELVARTVGDQPHAWRCLDVVALHEAVLPRLFPEGIDAMRFSSEEEEIRRLVDEDFSFGVLMKPLEAVSVVEVARSAKRMPQKASYFWPKAVTGLVFHPLS